MKERILSFLIKLLNKKDDELLNRVKVETGLSDDKISTNAEIIVGKILHQYTHFSVSTIDAFFQKIVKSFAKELGLLGNFKVELDQDKVKQEIIDLMIDELGEDGELTKWLVDFSFSRVDENSSWNIRPEIESLASEVFKESFKSIEKEITGIKKNDIKEFLNRLRIIKSGFERYMTTYAQKALDLIHSHGLVVDDFAYMTSGPAGYFNRIIQKKEFEPKKRVEQAIEDPGKWATKTSKKEQEIKRLAEGGLQELTISLVHHFRENIQEYTSAIEILKNFYVFGILMNFINKLKTYRREHDVMLISDVSVFLNGIIAENESPFIYEKTGTWYRNFLIDEFQDTSAFQWQNFKPLIESGISQGYKSLLVGDGKQSIYRWRGGDWNLILHQVKHDLQLFDPQEEHLNTNWRSNRKIVEFNNQLFGFLPSLIVSEFKAKINDLILPEVEKDRLLSMAFDVKKLYEDVIQNVSTKNQEPSKGRLEINVYTKNAEFSWKEAVLQDLPKVIERLQDAGIEPDDMAILVRRGEEGKQVIERLIQYKNSEEAQSKYVYNAISNESLFLANSTAIRIIVNAIKYCLNPEDKIALGEICFNYQLLQGKESEQRINDLGFILTGENLPMGFFAEKEEFIRLPVYEMIERIIQLFNIGSAQEKEYLQAFQDVILDYFSNESKDIHDFLIWWDETGKRKSIQIPESMRAIRVMTIHKSKGLEFKAVLVPFCNWKLDHDATKANYIWCRSDKKPFSKIGYLPLKYSSNLGQTYFSRDYFEEMIKAHIDNLNLLYVALTRAENYLMLNCPPPSGDIKNAGDLVLKGTEYLIEESRNIIEINIQENEDTKTSYAIGQLEAVKSWSDPEKQETTNKGYTSSDWKNKIAVKKRGGILFDPESMEIREKINYGLLVHELLASIIDEAEADKVIEKYYTEGRISKEDKITIGDHLNRIFANPQVKSWFNTDWKVKNEIPIIIKDDHPKRPDRVLTKDKQAIIIDFKTGVEKTSDKKQVMDYKAILSSMGYQIIEAYLLYISLNKVVRIA